MCGSVTVTVLLNFDNKDGSMTTPLARTAEPPAAAFKFSISNPTWNPSGLTLVDSVPCSSSEGELLDVGVVEYT